MNKNTPHTTNLRHRKSMLGLSLIEILVTVVVLSIGLLGIAGMQAFGMRYNNDSYVRSQAVAYANDLVERMRANPNAVNTGAYKTAMDAQTPATCTTVNDPANAAPTCTGTAVGEDCNVAQMAGLDVFRIQCGYSDGTNLHTGIVNELPLGNINIGCTDAVTTDVNPCTNDNSRTITISWQNPDEKDDPTERLQVEINAQFL